MLFELGVRAQTVDLSQIDAVFTYKIGFILAEKLR